MKWNIAIKPYPENSELEAIGFLNGKVVVFGSVSSKESNKVTIYARRIDNTGTPEDKQQPGALFDVQGDRTKPVLITSRDRNRIALVSHGVSHVVKTAVQSDHFAILDTALNLTEQKVIHLPYSDKLYSASAYAVSTFGDIVTLGLLADKPKGKREIVFKSFYSPAGDTGVYSMVVGEGRRVRGLGVEFDNVNRKAVYAGFYESNDAGMMAGILYAAQGMEPGNTLQVSAKPIDPNRNMKLTGKKYSRTGISLVNFPIERLILRNNGGAVLVTEAAYTSEYSYYDYFMQTYNNRVEYHFEDIVVLSIDNTGEAEWSTVIEKEQISMDDGGFYSSFTSLLNSEELIVLYNDDISRDNQVVAVRVIKSGEPELILAAKKDARMLLIPRAGKQVSLNEIVVPAYQKKALVLVRFMFE
jgi:hypothetical protein